MGSIPPLKRCSKCKRELPATLEYFHRRKGEELQPRCKECIGGTFGIHRVFNMPPAKEGYVRCSKCLHEKPATLEYFSAQKRKRNGLASHCRKCASKPSPDKKREHDRKYYQTHKDEHNERCKRYRLMHLDRESELGRNWRKNNADKVAERQRRRRHQKRSIAIDFTTEQWKHCLEWWNHTCAYCGAQQSFWHPLEQDHVKPLVSGGTYTADNIVPACKSCNSSKNDSDVQEWLKSRFGRKAKAILERINVYLAQAK